MFGILLYQLRAIGVSGTWLGASVPKAECQGFGGVPALLKGCIGISGLWGLRVYRSCIGLRLHGRSFVVFFFCCVGFSPACVLLVGFWGNSRLAPAPWP